MGEVKFKKSVSFKDRNWNPGDIAEIEDDLERKNLEADPDAIEKLEEPELKIGKESLAKTTESEDSEELIAVN